jgi:hypothetical protein
MVMIVEQLVESMSGREIEVLRRKPAPEPLCPQIPHNLTRARTPATIRLSYGTALGYVG